MHPNYFEQDYIKNLTSERVFEEMILELSEFDEESYNKNFSQNISFGFYKDNLQDLQEAVAKVDEDWVQYFQDASRVYCGYIDGKIASFCLLDDMGIHKLKDRSVKVGGPGCVGTIPEFRNKGIGLIMVKKGTKILKEEGYDLSYIHYTGVAPWYAKLGYKTIIKWNKKGIVK